MPANESDVADLLREQIGQIEMAAIEFVTPMPKQGLGSTWKFGQHYGFLRGLLIALKIPFVQIRSQVWQPGMGIVKRGTKTQTEHKNATKAMAQQMWPELKLTHATADCLLIAEFCRRQHHK